MKTPIFKRFWWVGVIVAVLLLVAFIFLFVKLKENPQKNPENPKSAINSATKTGSNCPPFFTKDFTDVSKIQAFQPIGSITGASRGRSYVTIEKGQTVPVYLPVDATLFAVVYAYRGPTAPAPEYGFWFKFDCNYTLLLDHLDSATEAMKQYAPKEAAHTSAFDSNVSVPLKAGTLLGYSDGTPQARTFDFLVMNQSHKATYINPARWQWDQSLYSVCPYDLFTSDLKAKYYQKLGVPTNSGLNQTKNCGQVSYDIAGTISGGWFLTPDATDMKGEFVLVGEIDKVVYVVNKSSSEDRIAGVNDYYPPKLPQDVKVGETVCYTSGSRSWFYLKLIDVTTLQTSFGTGSCPGSFPTTNKKTFHR